VKSTRCVGLLFTLGLGPGGHLDAGLRNLRGDVGRDQFLVDGEPKQPRQQRGHAVGLNRRAACVKKMPGGV
jgi:hypothetical protein